MRHFRMFESLRMYSLVMSIVLTALLAASTSFAKTVLIPWEQQVVKYIGLEYGQKSADRLRHICRA